VGEEIDVSALGMLGPKNCAIGLIDYPPVMFQGVQSHDRQGARGTLK